MYGVIDFSESNEKKTSMTHVRNLNEWTTIQKIQGRGKCGGRGNSELGPGNARGKLEGKGYGNSPKQSPTEDTGGLHRLDNLQPNTKTDVIT